MDVLTIASSHARGLRFFCEITQATAIAARNIFFDYLLYSVEPLPTSTVEIRTQDLIDHIINFAAQQISTATSLFVYAISSEMLISALGTNTVAYMSTDGIRRPSFLVNAYRMNDGSICHCWPLVQCIAPATVYSNVVSQSVGILEIDQSNSSLIKGMKTGCYPLTSLLASTLECYYDSSCLQLLVSNVSSFPPLDSTVPSRYAPDTTVQDLVRELMKEVVSFNYSVETYYSYCAPRRCDYTYTHRNTLLTIMTTIIGIISGLNTGLRLIIPLFVKLIMKLKKKCGSHSNTVPIEVVSSGAVPSKIIFGAITFIRRRLCLDLQRANNDGIHRSYQKNSLSERITR